jgi:hypothetical protein
VKINIEKERIKYTLKHRKAFRKVEKELLGYNTFRSLFHDFDKLILYLFFRYEIVHDFHRKYSRHHEKASAKKDYIQMVIDWECARYTKPDKPLNARKTLHKFYPNLENKILPILKEFNL